MAKILGDVNNLNRKQLMDYIKNNAKYVNSQLKDLSKNEMEYSKAFQYVQNKLKNKEYMRMNSDGNIEFKSRKAELEKLTYNQLRGLAKKLSDYKTTGSGTVRGQEKLIEIAYNSLKSSSKLSRETQEALDGLSLDEYKKIFESQSFQENKEKFGSDQILRFIGSVGFEKANDVFMNQDVQTLYDMYKGADALENFLYNEEQSDIWQSFMQKSFSQAKTRMAKTIQ